MASSEEHVIEAASAVTQLATETLALVRGAAHIGFSPAVAEAVASFKRVADLMELAEVETRAQALTKKRDTATVYDEAAYSAAVVALIKRRAELLEALWPDAYPDVVDAEVVD